MRWWVVRGFWVEKSFFQRAKEKARIDPDEKLGQNNILYTQDPLGEYEVSKTIVQALDEIKQKKLQKQ